MIIKSKSIRSKRGIAKCLRYILAQEKGANNFFLTKYLREKNIDSVIEQFIEGENLRQHPRKNSTTLMHEILSWENSEVSEKQLKAICRYYIQRRAPHSRVAVCLHKDTEKYHLHLAIAGITTDGKRSSRISKERFTEIKKMTQEKERELGIEHSKVRHGLSQETNVKKN